MAASKTELDEARELVNKITKIIETQHRKKADEMTDGQLKSIHKAYEWIGKANEDLSRAKTELKKKNG